MRLLSVRMIDAPASIPVTVDEFIDHARLNGITVGRQPDLIDRELAAATRRAERFLRRSLITQKLAAAFAPDALACDQAIHLPRGRAQSVLTVGNSAEVHDPATYRLVGESLIQSDVWFTQATEVVWMSGYGDAGHDVPDNIREGILEYATGLYCDRMGLREAKYASGAGMRLPLGIADLWRPDQIELSG